MDLATVLAAVVAVLVLCSGYFLFHDLPTLDKTPPSRRPTRRP